MIVYVTKTNELVTVSSSKIPYDSSKINEIDIGNVALLPEKEGFRISDTWDSATKKLIQEYVVIEGYTPSEKSISQEEFQAQILLNIEYIAVLTEIRNGI